MFKSLPALATAALLAVTLTGCGGDSIADPAASETTTKIYRGQALTCIERGLSKAKVRTCDFAAFYAEHPDLLAEDPASTEDVWWTTYRDREMPCYREGLADAVTLSCDFTWFYALNPDLAAG